MSVPITIANMVYDLWEKSADGLSIAELEHYSNAGEIASMYTQNLEDLVDNLGLLITCDLSPDHKGVRAGLYQGGRDVPTLLLFLAESIRTSRAMFEVADSASYRLRKGIHGEGVSKVRQSAGRTDPVKQGDQGLDRGTNRLDGVSHDQ